MTRRIVIAIDGPAASGKSSTAQWVAERLGFKHVDSGAFYRAATAAVLRTKAGTTEGLRTEAGTADGGTTEAERTPARSWNEDEVLSVARRRVQVALSERGFEPTIDGAPADDEIRGAEVTRHVSTVARMPRVRAWVNEQVREAAKSASVVVDGRDMGTAVFPDADLKIFLVADPWERARRRLAQHLQRAPSDEEIAEETDRLVHRDARDATQTAQAPDAVLLDTTYLTQEDQVDRIVALARAVSERGDGTSGT